MKKTKFETLEELQLTYPIGSVFSSTHGRVQGYLFDGRYWRPVKYGWNDGWYELEEYEDEDEI